MVNRREFLWSLLVWPLCTAAASGQEWNYRENGPERWRNLDRSFSQCGAGDQQSTIDLRDGTRAELPKVTIQIPKDRVTVLNKAHLL
jgi:carbonic anhydrase